MQRADSVQIGHLGVAARLNELQHNCRVAVLRREVNGPLSGLRGLQDISADIVENVVHDIPVPAQGRQVQDRVLGPREGVLHAGFVHGMEEHQGLEVPAESRHVHRELPSPVPLGGPRVSL